MDPDRLNKMKKAIKPAHGNRMQTHFVKYCAHPGAANRQKCAQHKMCGNRRGIGQVSEYITGPEIKKHRNDKTYQPVLAVFQGKTLD